MVFDRNPNKWGWVFLVALMFSATTRTCRGASTFDANGGGGGGGVTHSGSPSNEEGVDGVDRGSESSNAEMLANYFAVPKQETYSSLASEQFGSYGVDVNKLDPYSVPGIPEVAAQDTDTRGDNVRPLGGGKILAPVSGVDGPKAGDMGGPLVEFSVLPRVVQVDIAGQLVTLKGIHYRFNKQAAGRAYVGVGRKNVMKIVGEPGGGAKDRYAAAAQVTVALIAAQIPGVHQVIMGGAVLATLGIRNETLTLNGRDEVVLVQLHGGTEQWLYAFEVVADRGDVVRVLARLKHFADRAPDSIKIEHAGIVLRHSTASGLVMHRARAASVALAPDLLACQLLDGSDIVNYRGTVPVNVVVPNVSSVGGLQRISDVLGAEAPAAAAPSTVPTC